MPAPSESTITPPIGLSHPSGARAAAYPHGAHVATWWPSQGTEVLFVSERAIYESKSAIRGGVPVIFPQFGGAGPLPKHGLARTMRWEALPRDAMTVLAFRLRDSVATRAIWPHAFSADYTITLDEHSLTMELAVTNTDERPFDFTAALHTYLRVGDVREVAVHGLHGARFRQQGDVIDRRDEEPALRVDGPLDRVYLGVDRSVDVVDPGLGRTITIEAAGFPDVVVWNPWEAGAAALPDLAADEYLRMLCVESAVVGEPVRLDPRCSWVGRTTLTSRRIARDDDGR